MATRKRGRKRAGAAPSRRGDLSAGKNKILRSRGGVSTGKVDPAGLVTRRKARASVKLRTKRQSGKSLSLLKSRSRQIVAVLKKEYPGATCALRHQSPFELLIATILSAQSTDETVNRVTPVLFSRFPTPESLAASSREVLESLIYPTGFFRQKAKNIQGACTRIAESFFGEVPDTMEGLLTLPGVARKTANVVLGTAFDKNEGVVVDTHVGRLAFRLGLTWTGTGPKDAVKIERDLMEIVPRDDWTFLSHALIWHGRRVCTARDPKCQSCALVDLCPSAYAIKS